MWYKARPTETKEITPFDMPVLKVRGVAADTISNADNIAEIEREAYEKGFEAGEKAGFDMGEKKAEVLTERLENIVKELVRLRKETIQEIEPQCVELAVSIARKIILRELAMDPDGIVEITKEALMRIERTGQIVIKINSSLYDLFMKHNPEILNIHPDVVFDIDPSAPLHGSVVMSPVEDVVTDVDDQLRNLIKEMGDRLGGD